jgi:hypothetical protein
MIKCELQELFLWTSVQEIGIYLALFIIFCASPSSMAYIWLFLPHIARGITGLVVVLVKGLPKSHNIIEAIEIDNFSAATVESL